MLCVCCCVLGWCTASESWRSASTTTVSVRYGPCLPVIQPPVQGGTSRGLARARLALSTVVPDEKGYAFVQGFSAALRPNLPDTWWIAGLRLTPNRTSAAGAAAFGAPNVTLLWNRTETVDGTLLDHSVNMAWALLRVPRPESTRQLLLLVISPDRGAISALDPDTGATVGSVPLGWSPRAVVTDETGAVFVNGINGSQWSAKTVVQKWSANEFMRALSTEVNAAQRRSTLGVAV